MTEAAPLDPQILPAGLDAFVVRCASTAEPRAMADAQIRAAALDHAMPADLPLVAQTPPGGRVRFQRVTLDQALSLDHDDATLRRPAAGRCQNPIRDPAPLTDRQPGRLVDDATRGDELEEISCRSI